MSASPKDVDPSLLNERDTRFLLFAVQSMRGGEQPVDYPRLASAAGMSLPTAKKAWSRLRLKLGLNFNSASTAVGRSPATAKKRKADTQLVKGEGSDGDDGAENKDDGAENKDDGAKVKDEGNAAAKDEGASDEAKECIAVPPKANKKAKTTKASKKVKSPQVAKEESTSDEDVKTDVQSVPDL